MKPSKDTNRLSNALEAAENSFWHTISEAYPEAPFGDFAPDAAIKFSAATEEAVTLWLEINADPIEKEWRTTEIMLHRIEYNYEEDMELTDGDREHIAYSISQGISEGELSTLVPVTSEQYDRSVRGYWQINNVI